MSDLLCHQARQELNPFIATMALILYQFCAGLFKVAAVYQIEHLSLYLDLYLPSNLTHLHVKPRPNL